MRKWASSFAATACLFFFGTLAHSQTAALPVTDCIQHGIQAQVSGLPSTNFQQGIIPSCTVTVYLTGTQTIATTTPQSPFTANTNGSIPPIFAAVNQGYDVVLSGGIAPNTYAQPLTITAVYPGFSFSGGGTAPPSPAFVVPYTNSGVTGFNGDFLALNVNPTTHIAAGQYSATNSIIKNRSDIKDVVSDGGATCNGIADDAPAIQALINANPGAQIRFPNIPFVCHLSSAGITVNSTHIMGSGSNYGSASSAPTGSLVTASFGITAFTLNANGGSIEHINIVGSEPASTTTTDQNNVIFPTADIMANPPLTTDINPVGYSQPISSFSVTSGVMTIVLTGGAGWWKAKGIANVSGIPAPNASLNGTYYITTASNAFPPTLTVPVTGASNVSTVTLNGNCYPTSSGCVKPATTGTSASDGILIKGANGAKINDVYVASFGNDCIEVNGESNISDDPLITNTWVNTCRVHGMYIHGQDSNQGVYSGDLFYQNALFGLFDVAFLGSVHIGPQASYNHGGALPIGSWPPRGTTFTTTSLSRSGNVISGTTSANHNFQVGNAIDLLGYSDSSFNTPAGTAGCFVLTVPAANQFTCTQPGFNLTNVSTSGGTVQLASMAEAFTAIGVDGGSISVGRWAQTGPWVLEKPYAEATEAQDWPNDCSIKLNYNVYVTQNSFGDCIDPNFKGVSIRSSAANGTILDGVNLGWIFNQQVLSLGGFDAKQSYYAIEAANDTAAGTSVELFACVASGTNTLTICPTTATSWVGVSVGGAQGAVSGNAVVAASGTAFVICDAVPTLGDYAILSPTVAGECHDTGSPNAPTSGTIAGIVIQATNPAILLLQPPATGGGGGGSPASPFTFYQLNNSGVFGTGTLSEGSNTVATTATQGLNATQATLGASGSVTQIVTSFFSNDVTTGTTANFLCKPVGNTLIKATTSDTSITLYPCLASWTSKGVNVCASGTAGQGCRQDLGIATLTADAGGIVSGDYVGESTTVAGAITDLGTTFSGAIKCLGSATGTIAANATGSVSLGTCPSALNPNASSLMGYCTGVVGTGASATYYIWPNVFGNYTCSGNAGATYSITPVSYAGVVKNLQVRALTGGASASACTIKFIRNGTATTLAATLGTATTASDTNIAHAVTMGAGDYYGFGIVTSAGGNDACANVAVSAEFQAN